MIYNKQALLQEIEKPFLFEERKKIVRVGATLRIRLRIQDGEKERFQNLEGTVIKMRGAGISSSFTIREISWHIGTEITFPLHSPKIVEIKFISQGRIRRAKLYYLRKRVGKAANLKPVFTKKRKVKKAVTAKTAS